MDVNRKKEVPFMKRLTALLLVIIFVTSLTACSEAVVNEPSRDESIDNSAVSDASDESVNESTDESTDKSVNESTDESVDESTDESVEDDGFMFSTVSNGNLIYITEDSNTFSRQLWIRYSSGESFKLFESDYIVSAEPSPNGKYILFTEYEWEVVGKVYLFDVESKESRELEFEHLRKDYLPYNVEWLDDDNFLFTDIFSHGTVAAGGYVYRYRLDRKFLYLTEVFITPPDGRLQISDIKRSRNEFILTAYYFEEGFAEHEALYYVIPETVMKNERRELLLPQDGITDGDYRHYAEVPSLEERANLDYVASVEGGRELDYEALIKMTPDEIESEIFEPANRIYREFSGLGGFVIYSYGSLNFYRYDKNNELVSTYVDVVSPDSEIPSYEGFVAETRKYFSVDMSKKLFADGHFFEYEGIFLFYDGARGSHINYRSHEYSIESHSKNEIVYKCTVKLVKDEFIDLKDEDIKEEHCFYEDFTCTLILEDGKWVFDSFRLPY